MKFDAKTLDLVYHAASLLSSDAASHYLPELAAFTDKLKRGEVVDLELYLCCEYLVEHRAIDDCMGILSRSNGKIIFRHKKSRKHLALLIDLLHHDVRVEDTVFPFNLREKTVCDSVAEAWCAA